MIKSKSIQIYDLNFTPQLNIGFPIGNNRNFNFDVNSNLGTEYSDFFIKDNLNNTRLQVFTNSQIGSLSMYDNNQSEIFAIKQNSTAPSGLRMFLHMPLPDTKVVIGGYADYLLAEGHNFIVKDGSALIEGNIFTDESVGIGTRNFVDGTDVYKLSVKGKIRADAVKVYTTWADFVFEKGYELPSLNEVENFIKKNGHLKGVPSASIVEKNGIELGEMNKILLQKIEELTLYIIELNKEIQLLKK